MVARNPKTNQAAPITPLIAETAEEKFFYEQGERKSKFFIFSHF
jgi:hypothetical protein